MLLLHEDIHKSRSGSRQMELGDEEDFRWSQIRRCRTSL